MWNGLRYGYGPQKRTTPGITSDSLLQRRFSPVSAALPWPEPWNERYAVRILCRPVSARANLIASSFAAAPPVVKKARQPSAPHGAIALSASPSRARDSANQLGGLKHSRSICSCIAWRTVGWPWPRFTATKPDERSA